MFLLFSKSLDMLSCQNKVSEFWKCNSEVPNKEFHF